MQVNDARCSSSVDERKEKVEAALATLKSLKSRVSELRAHCEALKLESEKQEGLTCNECGKLIEQGDEVTLKDSFASFVVFFFLKGKLKSVFVNRNI